MIWEEMSYNRMIFDNNILIYEREEEIYFDYTDMADYGEE